jgi:prolyl-tRNA synthetase
MDKNKVFEKKGVTKKSENISDWYIDVITKSGMADYSPVKGCIVYRPLSYSIWENIQHFMNAGLKQMDVENCYFPLFIPESFLKKEASHVEGFAPELAVVTIAGGEELEEKLVVRPTSETIMYTMYSKWIQSHRDLPLKLNQWNNVVRWEKRTYPFIRGAEFLWQEAHTAHATHEECWQQVLDALDLYARTYEELMALPVIKGLKSQSEKFAGAVNTTTCENIMPDGKALQSCTSHDLGQNFSKAFDVMFQDKEGQNQYVHQTSFGYSTRSLGGLVMVHGDDQGLVLPPRVAPIQVIIVPIGQEGEVLRAAENIKLSLEEKFIRAKLDIRPEYSLGFKRNEHELKGTPVRIEIGQKELESGMVSVSIRHNSQKEQTPIDSIGEFMKVLLDKIHNDMFEKAKKMQHELTSVANTYDEFKQIMDTKKGFIYAHWCEDADCEAKIKEETNANTRCLPFDQVEEKGKCIYCGKDSNHKWLFAQAY